MLSFHRHFFQRGSNSMFKYIVKRILLGIVSLFIIMTMLFVLIRMLPTLWFRCWEATRSSLRTCAEPGSS